MKNDNLFSDEDLQDILAEFNKTKDDPDSIPEEEVVADIEITASQRRYEEIIRKHKMEMEP